MPKTFPNPWFSRIRSHPYLSKGYEATEVRNAFTKWAETEQDDSLILVYQDEVRFQIQTIVTGGYKQGSLPAVKSFSGRVKISYSGFIIPESGELFAGNPETFNYETKLDPISAFLKVHHAPEGQKYALVMDNAPWHKKRQFVWLNRKVAG